MQSSELSISGTCDARFDPLREVFERSFQEDGEIGASLSVSIDGEKRVDLWAGHADPDRTRPWQRDTIANLYSTTKGMTALCALRLVERSALVLDEPVASYWPEFAQAGKGDVTVRQLMSHQAGLPAIRETLPPEALYDWDAMCSALAAEAPWWKPGDGCGYHPVTFGWLVGELVRRVDGRSLGTYFREEIAEPLGAEIAIGLDEAWQARAADITAIEPPAELARAFSAPSDEPNMVMLAFMNPIGTGDHNSPVFRSAEIPAMNGHGNARALSRIYGALARGGDVDGVHVLDRETLAEAARAQTSGNERLFGLPMRFGLGFLLGDPGDPRFSFGPCARAFGHPGAGGSVGFADPDARLAMLCRRGLDKRPDDLLPSNWICDNIASYDQYPLVYGVFHASKAHKQNGDRWPQT